MTFRDEYMRGLVYDIQRYSVDDGPGIRTLVFMKGCPLRCEWCANPESQSGEPQVMYYQEICKGCGKCLASCPKNCIKEHPVYGLVIDEAKCDNCGICVNSCYYGARKLIGKLMSVDEVIEIIMKDIDFYINSGGGVTISGGEPLMQYCFVKNLLIKCKKNGINTAIETCGYAEWEAFESVLPYLDLIFFDYKHFDPLIHKKFTGRSNELIKNNLIKLKEKFKNIIVRIPYIPGFNSSLEDLEKMFCDIEAMDLKNVEVLPYHRIGREKYSGLGREYLFDDLKPVLAKDIKYLIDIGKKYKFAVKINGINN